MTSHISKRTESWPLKLSDRMRQWRHTRLFWKTNLSRYFNDVTQAPHLARYFYRCFFLNSCDTFGERKKRFCKKKFLFCKCRASLVKQSFRTTEFKPSQNFGINFFWKDIWKGTEVRLQIIRRKPWSSGRALGSRSEGRGFNPHPMLDGSGVKAMPGSIPTL